MSLKLTLPSVDPNNDPFALWIAAYHHIVSLYCKHSSATAREEKSHIINASLKRRARRLITNGSIPRQTRSLIQYALGIKDPDLVQLVHRVETGEMTIDHVRLG